MEPIKKDSQQMLQRLWLEKRYSDVLFKVRKEDGTTEDIQAHKVVMASSSEVFEAMLFGPLAEKGDIYMEDNASAFRNLLEFIYGRELKIQDMSEAIAIARISDKYLVQDLNKFCMDYIKLNTTLESIPIILEAGLMPNIKVVIQHFEELLTSRNYLTVFAQELKPLMEKIKTEIDPIKLFKFVFQWAEHQHIQYEKENSTVRDYFEPFLPYIRFLKISLEDLVYVVIPTKVLSSDEISAIGTNLKCNGKLQCPLPIWCDRTCTVQETFQVNHGKRRLVEFRSLGSAEVVSAHFTVSNKVMLTSLGFLVSWSQLEADCVTFTARLFKKEDKEELLDTFTFKANHPGGRSSVFPVHLSIDNRPVRLTPILLPRYWFKIAFEPNNKPPSAKFHDRGIRIKNTYKCSQPGLDRVFVFHNFRRMMVELCFSFTQESVAAELCDTD